MNLPDSKQGNNMPNINLQTFEELKQLSGEDVMDELIQAFLDEAPVMLGDLHAALRDQNIESFRRNAHSLKSNANTFGAEELASLAKELESLARDNQLGKVGDKLDRLSASCAAVQSELKRMMK